MRRPTHRPIRAAGLLVVGVVLVAGLAGGTPLPPIGAPGRSSGGPQPRLASVHPAAASGPRDSTGGIAFDAQNGYVYVSSSPLDTSSFVGSITAIDGATNQIVMSENAGDQPGALALDPSNGYLYAANQITVGSSGTVTVLDAATLGLVATLPVGPTPQGALYDPANGNIYVCNLVARGLTGSNTTTIIAGAGDTEVGSIPVGCGENTVGDRLALDPATGALLIANPPVPLSPEVTVVNTTSESVASPFGLPNAPEGIAPDPTTGIVYLTDGSNVTAINASSGAVTAEIGVGHPSDAIALDPADGRLFVANYSLRPTNVTVLDTATGRSVASIPTGPGPDGMVYDARNGCLYLVNLTGGITVINGSTNAVVATLHAEGPAGGSASSSPVSPLVIAGGVGAGLVAVGVIVVVWRRRGRRPGTAVRAAGPPGPDSGPGGPTPDPPRAP